MDGELRKVVEQNCGTCKHRIVGTFQYSNGAIVNNAWLCGFNPVPAAFFQLRGLDQDDGRECQCYEAKPNIAAALAEQERRW
jgi:hypothetical protein